MRPWYMEPNQTDRIIATLSVPVTFIVFDTETTGLDTKTNELIEFAAQKYGYDAEKNEFEKLDEIDIYIKPENKVPQEVENLTGITNKFLETKSSKNEAYGKIKEFIGAYPILIAFNKRFDIEVMSKFYSENNDRFKYKCAFDVLVMTRDTPVKMCLINRKLETVTRYLNLEDGLSFHNALSDTEATFRVFKKLYEMILEQNKKN